MDCHLRRRTGMPTSRIHPSAEPPTVGQKSFLAWPRAEVAAVVFTVSVVVCADAPVMATEAGRLHMPGSLAAAGVILQVRLTVSEADVHSP